MTNVEFNSEQDQLRFSNLRPAKDTTPVLNRLVIKLGLAKTPEAANIVLIITSVICLVIAGYFVFKSMHGSDVSPIDKNIEAAAERE